MPLGSASIAQSHGRGTRTGEQVILKVVKPGIRDLLYRDAILLRTSAAFLQLIIARYQPKRVIDEFCDYTLREVDLTLEADNAETFAENFEDEPDVVFPRIYRQLLAATACSAWSSSTGMQPDDERVRSLPEDGRQRLIDLGAEAIIRMLYQDGFFHADLHPANLLILPEPKSAFSISAWSAASTRSCATTCSTLLLDGDGGLRERRAPPRLGVADRAPLGRDRLSPRGPRGRQKVAPPGPASRSSPSPS